MKKNLLLLSLCGLILLGTGCGQNKVKLKNGKEVVASVKGKKITAEDLYDQLKASYGSTTVLNVIDSYIANKEVKTTDTIKKNAQKQIDEMKSYYEQQGYKFKDILSQYGYSDESTLLDEYILNLKKEEVVKNYLADKVTDEEMQKYYDAEIYGDYTVKHILVSPKTTDKMTDSEKAKAEEKALKKAEKVIEKLNNGEKWATLVKKYSDDSATVKDEGLVSDFTKGDMTDEFFEASTKLKDGKYTTEPVKSEYGYHIILKVSNTEKPKLKDVKTKVIDAIVSNKLSNDTELSNNTWYDIRDSYNLKINDTDLSKSYKK